MSTSYPSKPPEAVWTLNGGKSGRTATRIVPDSTMVSRRLGPELEAPSVPPSEVQAATASSTAVPATRMRRERLCVIAGGPLLLADARWCSREGMPGADLSAALLGVLLTSADW